MQRRKLKKEKQSTWVKNGDNSIDKVRVIVKFTENIKHCWLKWFANIQTKGYYIIYKSMHHDQTDR